MSSPSKSPGETPRLVVVVPTKNRRVLLERALQSVRSQSYKAYRIVIIDDGSSDDTPLYLASLRETNILTLRHEHSRGVNAARNTALRTLVPGEWAVQLDDDDMLLPDTLHLIAAAIEETPSRVELLFFNTRIRRDGIEYEGGRRFDQNQKWRDFTYEELMQGVARTGDSRMVLKWTLFPQHLFDEQVNGFESAWILSLALSGIGIRYRPEQTTWIDLTHRGEHLSAVAAKQDPYAFTRVHARMLHEHADYFRLHPREAASAALGALKLAIRAVAPLYAIQFALAYARSLCRLLFFSAQDQHGTQ